MTVVLQVPYETVREMSLAWDDAADEFGGAWRRLAHTEPRELSAEIGAAVEAFCENWITEFKTVGERAQGYADELRLHRTMIVLADERQADHLRSMLPWADRHAPSVPESPLWSPASVRRDGP